MKRIFLVLIMLAWTCRALAGPELAIWRDGKIVLLDTQTKQERLIIEDAAERSLQWTLDGKSLFFWKRTGNLFELWRWGASKNESTHISRTFQGGVRNAAISPDGSKLAIMGDQAGGLWLMDPDGKNPLRLTGDGFAEEKPTWSPDGKWIVFADLAMRDESEADKVRMDLYIIGADGKGKRRLVFSNGSCDSASWSGNTRVVYSAVRNKNSDLCLYDLEAQKETNLTNSPEDESHPQTSPDGKQIAFWRRTGNTHELWVHDLSTNSASKVSTAQQSPSRPEWSRDGKWLCSCAENGVAVCEVATKTTTNLGKGRLATWR